MALLAARRSARWGNVGDQEADGLTDGRTKIPRWEEDRGRSWSSLSRWLVRRLVLSYLGRVIPAVDFVPGQNARVKDVVWRTQEGDDSI